MILSISENVLSIQTHWHEYKPSFICWTRNTKPVVRGWRTYLYLGKPFFSANLSLFDRVFAVKSVPSGNNRNWKNIPFFIDLPFFLDCLNKGCWRWKTSVHPYWDMYKSISKDSSKWHIHWPYHIAINWHLKKNTLKLYYGYESPPKIIIFSQTLPCLP